MMTENVIVQLDDNISVIIQPVITLNLTLMLSSTQIIKLNVQDNVIIEPDDNINITIWLIMTLILSFGIMLENNITVNVWYYHFAEC